MYISINRKLCKFLHKHPDFKVVCNLDFIAQAHDHTDVLPLTDGSNLIAGWTDMELSMLYRNVTGSQHVPHIGTSLRAMIAEYAERFPVTDCFPGEVELQAQYVEERLAKASEDNEPDDYMYVKGSKIPAIKSSLWGRTVCALLPPDEAARIVQERITAQAKRSAALTHALAAAPLPSAPTQPKPVRQAGAPRSGVCKAIWDALDLDLKMTGEIPPRTRMKELMLKNGWHTSTASTQYSAWKKSKV
jgi:hypothetical protein